MRVTPGARRSEAVEASATRFRVRVPAPPVEVGAKAELQRSVAELLGVRRSTVAIARGDRGRDEVLHVAGVDGPPPALATPAPPDR